MTQASSPKFSSSLFQLDVVSAEALASSSGLLPAIFDQINMAVAVASPERDIVLWNRQAEQLFGYREAEIVGQSTRVVYADPLDFNTLGKERFNQAANCTQQSYRVRYRRKDGSVFLGETLGGPVLDDHGTVTHYIAFVKDVTHKAELTTTLQTLHHLTHDATLTTQNKLVKVLRLGTQLFGLPIGIISRIQEHTYTVMAASHPDNALTAGMEFRFPETYCNQVFPADTVKGFNYINSSELRSHPCYRNMRLESYLGTTLFVDNKPYGTLNFSSPKPSEPFKEGTLQLIRQLADWIGFVITIDQLKQADLTSTRFVTGVGDAI